MIAYRGRAEVLQGWRVEPEKIWCVIEKDDQILIVACNPSKVAMDNVFEVDDLTGSISVLWEDLTLDVVDGSFKPMSVRAYRGAKA